MSRVEALPLLKSDSTHEVLSAIRILSEEGLLSDLRPLLQLINHHDPMIQKKTNSAGATIIHRNMIQHYDDLEDAERQALVDVLKRLAPNIIQDLAPVIRGSDETKRLRAIRMMGLIGNTPEVNHLTRVLIKSPDEKVRATATRILGLFVTSNDHSIFLDMLQDPDLRVRANTVDAISDLKNSDLIYILIRLKKDQNNRIRANAIRGLYLQGQINVIQDIEQMVTSSDPMMNISGIWLIDTLKINSRSLIEECKVHLRSNNEQLVAAVNRLLTNISSP